MDRNRTKKHQLFYAHTPEELEKKRIAEEEIKTASSILTKIGENEKKRKLEDEEIEASLTDTKKKNLKAKLMKKRNRKMGRKEVANK